MADFQVDWLELGFRFFPLPLPYVLDEEVVWYTPYDVRELSGWDSPC